MRIRAVTTLVPILASLAVAGPAVARPLLMEPNPVVALVERADADRDGFVTREELDAAVGAAEAASEGEFAAEWALKMETYGLPVDSTALDIRLVYRETLRMVSEADADKDGSLSPREIKEYAMGRDHALRAGTVTALLAFDSNADMSVSQAEVAAAGTAFASEVKSAESLPPAERDAVLAPSRASRLASWRSTTAKVCGAAALLWAGVARDGRAGVETMREKGLSDAD